MVYENGWFEWKLDQIFSLNLRGEFTFIQTLLTVFLTHFKMTKRFLASNVDESNFNKDEERTLL